VEGGGCRDRIRPMITSAISRAGVHDES
jgi:hypothetical protein